MKRDGSAKLRQSEFETSSGIPIETVYTPEDANPSADYETKLSYPGEYPFTRGVQPTMYRGRLWTMRQYAGFGTAQQTNERFRYLLSQGQTGLSCAFDLPTQMGYDSDHALVAGEVGRVGVAIDSVQDMASLLQGLPLDQVSTSMTINAPASILLAMYIAVAEQQGISADRLSGTVQNDVLKEYIARGTYIFPLRESLRLSADIIEYCMQHVPKWNPISISGYHMREAGSTAAQEVAFCLSNGFAYLEAVANRGIAVDRFAPRLSFFFNAHNQLFEEVAKFRAARRIWARTLREKYGSTDPRAQMLRFHTQTAGSTLTAQQPLNNVVRVTVQALAAVLGGTQSLHTNAYDEALALPSEESSLLALRTQQILGYESGVTETVDPLGGSWFVESLTDQMEQQVLDIFARLSRRGGMLASIEDGWVQREIHNSAFAWQQQVDRKQQVVVGVNAFESGSTAAAAFRLDPELEVQQIQRVRGVRDQRDARAVQAALGKLGEAARGTENLMPLILDAVRACATVGEIADALRAVWGVYRPSAAI
ncbi:MAG: acyl-CoA mutase large subunit family protein [Candidatus Xenobia bacterium]